MVQNGWQLESRTNEAKANSWKLLDVLPSNPISEWKTVLQKNHKLANYIFHKNSQNCELLDLFSKLSKNVEKYCQAGEACWVNKLTVETDLFKLIWNYSLFSLRWNRGDESDDVCCMLWRWRSMGNRTWITTIGL